MNRIVLIALLTMTLLAPAKAYAAIDSNGARHLKNVFTTYLAQRQATIKSTGQELRADGPLSVEPAGTYYAITLPHLSLHKPDGSFIDLGIFAINALPTAKAGEWTMTIAAPSPIMGYTATKEPDFRISLGTQNYSGLWNESVDGFTHINADYKNIVIDQPQQGRSIKIPQTKISYDLKKNPNGKTWSGPAKYKMDNIQIVHTGQTTPSKIDSIILDTMIHDYDPQQAKESKTALFGFIGMGWNGADAKLSITNADFSRPGDPSKRIKIKNTIMNLNATGFAADSVTLRTNVAYDDFLISPKPAGFDTTFLNRMNMNIAFHKIPYRELVNALRDMAQTPDTPDAKKAAGLTAAKVIPQILSTAGSFAKISETSAENAVYRIDMNGQVDAKLNAVMGADGKIRMEITGMDKTIELLQEESKNPKLSADEKIKIQKRLAGGIVLQGLGQKGKTAKGTPTRLYDIELNEQGKVMMNGMDLTLLRTMMNVASGKAGKP